MHFNARFDCQGDTNTIVFNSLSGGSWGDELREGNFPFVRGEECKVGRQRGSPPLALASMKLRVFFACVLIQE